MAGFRLWEHVTIDDLLDHVHRALLQELGQNGVQISDSVEAKLVHSLKRVINEDMYASPACGTSSLCSPSEEGRAKPWSYQSARWGLVAHADPSLEH